MNSNQLNLVNTFLQEAEDLLAQIEETALDMEGRSADAESLNHLFRAIHTIKGSAAMFGFDEVSQFTHHLENTLDAVRSGKQAMSPDLLALVLVSKDHIKELLDAVQTQRPVAPEATESIIRRLASVFTDAPGIARASDVYGKRETATWHIRFSPDPALMACGGNPALLFKELRTLGACTVECHTDAVPMIEDLEPDKCVFWWDILLVTDKDEQSIRDVFMFVEDGSQIDVERQAMADEALPLRASAPQTQAVGPQRETSTEAAQSTGRKGGPKEATLRVPSGKLDALVNLVGELVMNQSRLTQAASLSAVPELTAPVEEIERLVAELRDNVLGIRMMPIGTTFSRFKRLVHDLSAELGKEIELVTEGAETELDKTVLDQLGDPLVHLIRNSIGHGIEGQEERLRAGKPVHGTIRLTAVHTGSNVVVRIQDDGRGLDPQAIRNKALEQQLISADTAMSDKEVFNLIFLPGFSTAREVTSVSGRGVGMDVVKRQIESLRGSVSVASERGSGATITLTLPLTLAIIDGLLVQIGQDQFIIPMALVTENVELHGTDRARNNGRNVTAVRGDLIPYISLRDAFDSPGTRPPIEKIVIAQHEDERVGVVVDRVIGSHQTVIQSLGSFYRDVQVCSGATIMGDGRVALILDVAGLVRWSAQAGAPAVTAIPHAISLKSTPRSLPT